MSYPIRKNIRHLIKESLIHEWIVGDNTSTKKSEIKKWEEFHRKEDETYEEYEERMMKKPMYRKNKTPGEESYSGSWHEAEDEWNQYYKSKRKKEVEERKKERKRMYNERSYEFQNALQKLENDPFYKNAMEMLENKNYDETLLHAVLYLLNKRAGNDMSPWQNGFMIFTEYGIRYQHFSFSFFNPQAKSGHYATLKQSRRRPDRNYSYYYQVHEVHYFVDNDPKSKYYTEDIEDDYSHSKRE